MKIIATRRDTTNPFIPDILVAETVAEFMAYVIADYLQTRIVDVHAIREFKVVPDDYQLHAVKP